MSSCLMTSVTSVAIVNVEIKTLFVNNKEVISVYSSSTFVSFSMDQQRTKEVRTS